MRVIDDDTVAAVRRYVEGRGGVDLVAGVRREVTIVIDDADGESLGLHASLRGNEFGLRNQPEETRDPAALSVHLDLQAARGTGNGELLLEELFAEGRVRLERATAEDYRLAPALELLLEGLARCGVLG